MKCDENPYQPPVSNLVDKALPRLQSALEFSGKLTRSDANIALRNGKALVVPIAMLAITMLPLMLILCLLALHAVGALLIVQQDFSLGLLALLLAPVWILMINLVRLRLFPAVAYLKDHPLALGPVQGRLSSTDLSVHSERGIAWFPLTSLTSLQSRAGELVLRFDPQGITTLILPMRFFADPVTAEQILLFYATQNPKVSLGVIDERKLQQPGPSMVGAPSEQTISFSGILIAEDIRPTPLKRHHRSLLIRSVLLSVFFITVPVLIGVFFNGFFALVSVVFFGMLSYRLVRAYFVGLKPLSDGQQPLINMAGWMDDQGITILNARNQGRSYWNCFLNCGSNEQAIWLRFPGRMKLYVVLPRHLFGNVEDYRAAQQHVATYVARVS